MGLRTEQSEFMKDLGKLLEYAHKMGYELTGGDLWSKPEYRAHKSNSQHYKKLAIDLNLFVGGRYQSSSEYHQPLGEFWESLNPKNRWGGRYHDGNHYERMERGWRRGDEKGLSEL